MTTFSEAFGRSMKIVIGQPERTVNKVVSGTVSSAIGVYDPSTSDATTIPAGKIVEFSNLESEGYSKRIPSFKFESTRGATQGGTSNEKTKLTLYNLNDETKEIINQPFVRVLVYLGYNEKVDLYYTGDVISIQESNDGLDHEYVLILKDGGVDDVDTVVGLEYDENMSAAEILTDLAKRFPTGSTGIVALDFLKNKYVIGGMTVMGNLAMKFDKLCKMYGVSYYKWNGKINLQPYKLVNGTPDYLFLADVYNTYIIPDNAIKSLDPVVQNKHKTSTDPNITRAVQLTTFLIPIELGQFFTIDKTSSERYAGTYKVTQIKIDADARGSAWDVTIRGEPM